MSLFPAFVKAQQRDNDSPSKAEALFDSADGTLDENIFNLLPPGSADTPAPESTPQGRNRHPVDMTDLSRLSIDGDGCLYWDGKAVETHHRVTLSRAQIVGAVVLSGFIVLGALGAAVQGAAAARDWACRMGWAPGACMSAASGDIRV